MASITPELQALDELIKRDRPQDVLQYSADYFKSQLQLRSRSDTQKPPGFRGFNTHLFTAGGPTAQGATHLDEDDPSFKPPGAGSQLTGAAIGAGTSGGAGVGAGAAAGLGAASKQSFPPNFNSSRRVSVSAESLVPGKNTAKRREAPIQEFSEEQLDRLHKTVGQNFLFKYMDEESVKEVLTALQERKVSKGTNIITQGEEGDYFYIIESGTVDFFKDGDKVNSSGAGSSFGELALLYNSPRAATVTATSESVLWALDRVSFRHIILEQSANKRSMYLGFLREVPLLKDLNDHALAKLSDAMKLQIYGPGEVIVKEGELGEDFYLIEYGTTDVSRAGEGVVTKLSKGDYFGEVALLNDLPRQATVTATSRTKVLSLDKSGFTRLLGSSILDTLKRQDPTHHQQH